VPSDGRKSQVTRRAIRYSCYAVVLLFCSIIIRQNAWQIEGWRYRIGAGRIRHVTVKPPGWEYYLHVPSGYTDQRLWPLFIYVHGTGGSGRDTLHIWRPRADREGFLFLAPTFPLKGYQYLTNGEDAVLWAMIAEVQSAYAVDPARVFVCGFSGGAQFAHRFAFRYPGRVSGVSTMSAGSYDSPPKRGQVPFAVSVGQADPERAALALRFVDELRRSGYPVWYETYPNVGHSMCDQAIDLTMRLFRAVALPGEVSMDVGGEHADTLWQGDLAWAGAQAAAGQSGDRRH
jgi:poly(3-hydroxybutyrate) depolymerase